MRLTQRTAEPNPLSRNSKEPDAISRERVRKSRLLVEKTLPGANRATGHSFLIYRDTIDCGCESFCRYLAEFLPSARGIPPSDPPLPAFQRGGYTPAWA